MTRPTLTGAPVSRAAPTAASGTTQPLASTRAVGRNGTYGGDSTAGSIVTLVRRTSPCHWAWVNLRTAPNWSRESLTRINEPD